jgi:hypothetical protein
MLDLQAFRQESYGGLAPGRRPLNSQQQLVLLRFESGTLRCLFAKAYKAANAVTKRSEAAVIDPSGACVAWGHPLYRITI